MSDTFISYSRRDGEFVRRLNSAFVSKQRVVWVDWQDIPRGEDWWQEIQLGVEQAESFICVVSEYWLTSEICHKELQHARANHKHVLPVIRQRIEEDIEKRVKGTWMDLPWERVARENWDFIRHLNWLFFDNDAAFDAEFAALLEALDEDQPHIKAHTRYQTRALEWERSGRNPGYLLVGEQLTFAEQWLAESADKEPLPTDLQRQYLADSRRAEDERAARQARMERRTRQFRRAALLAAVIAVVALITTVVAVPTTIQAVNSNATSVAQAELAATNESQAVRFRETVEFEATLFALDQDRARGLLMRFGVVPTYAVTPLPATVVAEATIRSQPTLAPTAIQTLAGAALVRVPAGCFIMGSVIDSAGPISRMCFESDYWIDRLEVTRAQYNLCVAAGVCGEAAANPYSTQANQPVNSVAWTDALAYCHWRGAHLPTEPEWEYAARGPDSLIYPWGDEFRADYLVYIGNSNLRAAPVGSRPPESASWVGALDLSGNVHEWVSTAYASEDFTLMFAYPYDPDDGREDLTRTDVLRVTRGGSFNDDESITRSAHRSWLHPTRIGVEHQLVGFRCAASEAEMEPPEAAG